MVNPTNQTNTTIPIDIYNILKQIKEKQNCTFDDVLDQLCELEFKYNYIERVQSYELYYNDIGFQFEITFKKENMVIMYKTPSKTVSAKISEWGVPDDIRKEFYTFITEEYARCILENMPIGLIFKKFDIYKLS